MSYPRETIEVRSFVRLHDALVPVEQVVGFVPNAMYVEGSIELTVNGTRVLEGEDYVDQLWAYIIRAAHKVSRGEAASFYYPGQPVKLEIGPEKSGRRVRLRLSYGSIERCSSFDTRRFLQALCDAATIFWLRHCEFAPTRQSFASEQLRRVAELARIDG